MSELTEITSVEELINSHATFGIDSELSEILENQTEMARREVEQENEYQAKRRHYINIWNNCVSRGVPFPRVTEKILNELDLRNEYFRIGFAGQQAQSMRQLFSFGGED